MGELPCFQNFWLCNACRSEKSASTSLDARISVGVLGWTLTPPRRPGPLVSTLHKLVSTHWPKTAQKEFLAAGGAGDPHTKLFFFPVVSAATCTDSHLEVDQSFGLGP
ncbi:hypothetical protein Taro_000300 [Colocasia esculenta]|uniref:Uncharacterized protein n=1 Tax=Colocasia esculenta TaxID=4460 RepID=A0A843TCP8_COLES|nr:hypothetical protein [Colocasia esculenta]